jgi:hypothetical protein
VVSAGSAILRPHAAQISRRFPRLRLTHSFKVLAFSSISCWKTVYPGQPSILVQSLRLNPPVYRNPPSVEIHACLRSVRFLLRTGKTFLAKIVGWRACQANQRVLFTTAMDMLNHLLASQVDHSLVRKLKIYTEPALLICDELGYLSLDQQTSNLFYQVISTRHSHKRSTLITTNTAFSDWGNILYNTTIATAIADRLVENSEIFLLGGDSLRKANKNPNPPAE